MDPDTRITSLPTLTVNALLRQAAEDYGESAAIRYNEHGGITDKSYRVFYRDSLAFAAYLGSRFPAPCHIALLGKTTYAYLVCLNGIFLSGNTAVPLDAALPKERLQYLLGDADAAGVFFDETAKEAEAAFSGCPKLKHAMRLGAVAPETLPDGGTAAVKESPEHCAAIFYTSGTTGKSKGVMLASAAIVSNVCFKEMALTGGHVALNVLPMHHIFSFSCDYLKNIKDGVTVCLSRGPAYLGEELQRYAPSVLRLVPMMADSLFRKVRLQKKREPALSPRAAAERVFGRNIKKIIVSGASYWSDEEAAFIAMGITVRQGYGMTETGPRIAVPDGNTCMASGGRVISICRVRLQEGEIQVKSPSLMSGYYKQPEETAKAFTPDGWFRTGDLGRLTPDNELFITGRRKNLIILANGENVSPEEVELSYADEPLVAEIEVFENNGKIAALIRPDLTYAGKHGITNVKAAIQQRIEIKNAADIAAREIDEFYLTETPLARTATGKLIRRNRK